MSERQGSSETYVSETLKSTGFNLYNLKVKQLFPSQNLSLIKQFHLIDIS